MKGRGRGRLAWWPGQRSLVVGVMMASAFLSVLFLVLCLMPPAQTRDAEADDQGVHLPKRPDPVAEEKKRVEKRSETKSGQDFGIPQSEDGSCSGEINIITQFPVLPERLPDLADGTKDVQDIERDRQYAQQKGTLHRQRRQEEYLDTLRKNLRNPHVKRIHLLLEKESDMGFIREQGVPDLCEKLRPVVLGRWMHYKDAFQYANTKLPGELCMIMNADIYLGEGFQHATHDVFDRKEKPHIYVLARWEGPSVFCVEKETSSCEARARVGSYDAFLYKSPLPLAEEDLNAIDYQQNIWGAENYVLNLLMTKGITATNPCTTLRLGHNHCDTFYRPQQGLHDGKYRVKGGIGRAAFVTHL